MREIFYVCIVVYIKIFKTNINNYDWFSIFMPPFWIHRKDGSAQILLVQIGFPLAPVNKVRGIICNTVLNSKGDLTGRPLLLRYNTKVQKF